MEDYLRSRKPLVIRENFDGSGDKLRGFLRNQAPIILREESNGLSATDVRESFSESDSYVIIPPLNTDIRFSDHLPPHEPSREAKGHGEHVPHQHMYGDYDPHQHEHPANTHPHETHTHENLPENFSWAVPTSRDSELDLVKKSLIHKVSSQHACGSCWAVSFADTMSDCLVVSGAVGWSPDISSTYIMSCVPVGNLHNRCHGGNPAAVAPYLERQSVADTSCVDYSWCSGDSQLCKSVASANHFDATTLADKLNDNIPKPCGCYYNASKYLYKLDSGSEVFSISSQVPVDVFRNVVKSHLLDFGPIIGGYVVLQNFFTGNFTDPNFNGGVYFDRADYNGYRGGNLFFSDSMTDQAAGLHAISIVGWGLAKNIQYDNNKVGDVRYWHCRNSWGENWGNAGGYFKIAMYPFNKIAQFDKQVMTNIGGPVGSMIFIRATQEPTTANMAQISEMYRQNIQRQKSDAYYMANPQKVRELNRGDILALDDISDGGGVDPGQIQIPYTPGRSVWIVVLVALVAAGAWWMSRR